MKLVTPIKIEGLVGEEKARTGLFLDPTVRPSKKKFLRDARKGLYPYTRAGRRYLFDLDLCREAIGKRMVGITRK